MPVAAADCTPRCFLPDTQRKQSLAASGGPPASASRRQLLLGTRLRPTQGAFRPAVDAGTLWWRQTRQRQLVSRFLASARASAAYSVDLRRICRFDSR